MVENHLESNKIESTHKVLTPHKRIAGGDTRSTVPHTSVGFSYLSVPRCVVVCGLWGDSQSPKSLPGQPGGGD